MFAYGDVDGKQYNAKLQHPLGVAYNEVTGEVAVADTYNHKIKLINDTNSIETLAIKWKDGTDPARFYEPSSLCFSDTGRYLLVSDTNNHRIIRIDMKTLEAEPFPLNFGKLKDNSSSSNTTVLDGGGGGGGQKKSSSSLMAKDYHRGSCNLFKSLQLSRCKQLTIQLDVLLADNLRFTEDAPQKWSLNATNSAFKSLLTHGELDNNGRVILQLQCIGKDDYSNRIMMKPLMVTSSDDDQPPKSMELGDKRNADNDYLKLEFCLSLCDDKCCLMKRFNLILQDDDEKKNVDKGNDTTPTNKRQEKFNIEISANSIKCT